ncbi:MAG: GntR family transcriptional regulator [Eubacteriales bacterium]|nr:GntR family transcriptional regulator [Eubacteriales bacterium]
MLRYKEIKNALMDEISFMKAGEKLKSRPLLCRKLDTTRATLDKAIRELEDEGYLYSVNGSGTYVKEQFTGISTKESNWAVIVPNVMDAIYPGLVRGVENVAQKYGINLILCNSDNDGEKQEHYIKRLISNGVDGFIMVPVISNRLEDNLKLYNRLTQANIPYVFCNRSVEGIDVPVVSSNDFYGGYIATKFLIEKGYRKIAYIAMEKYRTSMDRCHGYISALIENGIEVNRHIISLEKGRTPAEKLQAMLEEGQEIDAVFCFNDRVARELYQVIESMGKQVSDDIGMIGYDNDDFDSLLIPKLTSVSYKNVEIGEMAAEILWKLIHKEKISDFQYYLFQPAIVERDSCRGRQEEKE